MKPSLLVYFLLGLTEPGFAQPVMTKWAWSCADWAKYRSEGTAFGLEQYLVGEMNGLALGTGLDVWRLPTPIEAEQAYYWMDRHCENAPLDFLVNGIFALFDLRFGEGWNDQRQVPAN